MTDNIPETASTTPAAGESQTRAAPGGRKPEPERRAFEAGPAATQALARGQATNLEAAQGLASAQPSHELTDIFRDLFTPLVSAQMEANRWFDQMWRHTTGLSALAPLRTARPFAAGIAPALGLPAADLKETDKAYELSVELPGMSREDVDVRVERDTIRISGHKAEEHEETRADYRVSERRFGQFERTFPIPQDARRDAISANCKDGILKVVLPKTESAQSETRKIEIK
jgi:HSP20 family protein